MRELQHTMERAVILGDGSLLRPDNFLFQASSPRLKKEEEIRKAAGWVIMLHAYLLVQSGIPVLYCGDEIGQ